MKTDFNYELKKKVFILCYFKLESRLSFFIFMLRGGVYNEVNCDIYFV